jgi:RNA polymerase sigma-54 factor
MMTNRGMFELGFFFTNAITATDGQETFSAESIRHRIRQLIREESAADVLSDDHIVGVLRAEGVDIARRTVAKYRDGMNIPSSARRRRQKQAAGAMATAEHVAG